MNQPTNDYGDDRESEWTQTNRYNVVSVSAINKDITNDRMTDLLDQSEVDGRIEATDEAGTTTTDDPHGAEATGIGADSSTKGEYTRDRTKSTNGTDC